MAEKGKRASWINEPERLVCFYIGAIQYAKKKGRPWREDMEKLLRPVGVRGFNPITVEEQLTGDGPEAIAVKRDEWKRSGKWDKFHEQMWLIRLADIGRGVLCSDFVILYWQIGVEKGGTLDELYCAAKCGVPIFVVINQPINTMNDWVMDVLRRMEKEKYPFPIKDIMGEGLTKFARVFRSFKAVANHIERNKEKLLARKRVLKEKGILEYRAKLAPLFLFPAAFFDYMWSTRKEYLKWLEEHPEYQIKEPKDLSDIFEGKIPLNPGEEKE
jgi:hypothetical protein